MNNSLRGLKVTAITASQAKNSFGAVLDQVMTEGMVAITKHDRVRAVVLSVEEYERMVNRQEDPLRGLRAEFDNLVARMQTPRSRSAAQTLFNASPAALGDAAVRRAKKRS